MPVAVKFSKFTAQKTERSGDWSLLRKATVSISQQDDRILISGNSGDDEIGFTVLVYIA